MVTDETEWLTWRLEGVTASDIARAATGRYGGTYGVVADKLNPQPQEHNPLFDRGHRWEQPIADAVHILTGYTVAGEQAWCQHPTWERHRATVDGFLSRLPEPTIDDVEAVLEVKTSGVGVRADRNYWHAQCQWQMYVTQLPRALIANAVIDDTDDTLKALRLEWVDQDHAMQGWLIDLADDIASHVDRGELPDPDCASAIDIVKELTATADRDADAVDVSDIADQIAEYERIRAAKKAAEDRENELGALIRHRLGQATSGTVDGYRVTYSANSQVVPDDIEAALLAAHPTYATPVLDKARFKADHPELWEQSRRPIGARKLTVKEINK